MPSVLDRSALEQSPLADLHLLANELGVDGFRRLRKPELVDAIVARQSDEPVAAVAEAEAEERPEERGDDDEPRRGRRGRRGGRTGPAPGSPPGRLVPSWAPRRADRWPSELCALLSSSGAPKRVRGQ